MAIPEQGANSPTEVLQERIAYWQAIFDKIPTTDSAVDLRLQADADLDSHWPFADQMCDFKGMGRVERGDEGRIESRAEFFDQGRGESIGLMIVKFGSLAVESWQVAYMFDLAQSDELDEPHHHMAFLLPKAASIVVWSEIETVFEGIHQPHELLNQHSDNLAQQLKDPEFLEMPRLMQRRRILDALKEAVVAANQRGGIDKSVVIEEATRVYRHINGGKLNDFEELNVTGDALTGNCQGLSVLALTTFE